jgi:hypothetical protein
MGKENRRILRQAKKLQPDCILITGDLVSRDERNFHKKGQFLRKLREIAPVYLCLGNHELDLPPRQRQILEQEIRNAGCRLLTDETVPLWQTPKGQPPVYLAGASLGRQIYRDANNGFRHLADYTPEELQNALGSPGGCTILLAHNPLIAETYATWGADLVLSGHVHGGVVRLPFLGGVLSPERKFFPRYSKGSYQIGNTRMIVSGGIGKLRLFNPPEIGIIQLKSCHTK